MSSLLNQVHIGYQNLPRRVMIYGPHGIGKSTFAAMAEHPIFIQTEDGLANLDCSSFPLAHRYEDVYSYILTLHNEPHDYKTVVIDSLDWLEKLIWNAVCIEKRKESIEDFNFQKGYIFAQPRWKMILDGLNCLRINRGMTVIMTAHTQIRNFENPETDNGYDRYSPALHKFASALIQEWCDEILFATQKVFTKKVDETFGKDIRRAIGTGERILRTVEKPAHIAKRRILIPDEIPLHYPTYAAYVKGEDPLGAYTCTPTSTLPQQTPTTPTTPTPPTTPTLTQNPIRALPQAQAQPAVFTF